MPFGDSLGISSFLGGEKTSCCTVFLPPKRPKTPHSHLKFSIKEVLGNKAIDTKIRYLLCFADQRSLTLNKYVVAVM